MREGGVSIGTTVTGFLIGISWIGEIQVELIQPVYGPMISEVFIRKHGEGLHHIKERISQSAGLRV